MPLPFKPKLGQLVQWDNKLMKNSSSKLGMITDIIRQDYVEVTFFHNDWVIRLNIKTLTLLNDVED